MALDMLDLVLPSGISVSTLVALYQFDGPTLGLTDRSGNGHDLTMISGVPVFSVLGDGEKTLHTFNAVTTYPQTEAKAGVFNTTGALTIEWVAMVEEYNTGNEMPLFAIGDMSSLSSGLNVTALLEIREADQDLVELSVFHERGAGVNERTDFGGWTIPHGRLGYGALTRAADGVTYKLYADGEYLATGVTANPPDGGTGNIRIYIHGCNYSGRYFYGHTSSWRYCRGVEFTAEQIEESFNRIRV